MAAIWRSGSKLPREILYKALQGVTKPGQNSGLDSGNDGLLVSSSSTSHAGSMLGPWSLQSLQNALPILAAAAQDKKHDNAADLILSRRSSDPLLDFYVDKQKIEEAAKNIKAIDNRVGLNVIKEIKVERTQAAIEETESKPVQVEPVQVIQEEKTKPIEQLEVIQEETSVELEQLKNVQVPIKEPMIPKEACIQHHEIPQQPQFVPICEDPASHQWFPLPVVCQMFREQGRIYDLEALLWGSQGIRPEDRKCIYFWTLQAYADCYMFPQAVDLTRRLETERLSDEFPEYHSLMNSFAMAVYNQHTHYDQTANEVEVIHEPISIHEASPTPMSEEESEVKQISCKTLKKAIANKDIESCVVNVRGHFKCGSGKDLNISESSALIELLVKEEYLEEAIEVTKQMLVREAYPLPRIFRFLLNRLASTGKVEAMNDIGSYLKPKIKKEVSFDNRLCNAYLAAGRAKDFLNMLISELNEALEAADEVDNETLQLLKDKFPRGGAMGLLESDPDLVQPYTTLALKFVELGYVAPINVLWTYHFISGRHDLAEPLWNQYVKSCPQIMFQKVCQTARSTSNIDLAERLVVLLENAVVTNGARGIAYSCLLDVLTQNNEFDKGLKSLEQGLASGIMLEDCNRTALKRLKEGLQVQGRDFPYEIPKKAATTTITTSDFDEDKSSRSLTPML